MSHNHGDEETGGTTDECPMIMTFHFGNCESILFKSWTASTPTKFIISVFIIFVVSILYEALKYIREKYYVHCMRPDCRNNKDISSNISQQIGAQRKTIRHYMINKNHFLQTFMHFIQIIISYCLMLIVMTFNLWLFLAIILGATIGHFSFGWLRQRSFDMTDCH